jgi:hypothetical protein
MKKIGTVFLALTCLFTVTPLVSHAQSMQPDGTSTRIASGKPEASLTRTAVIQATVDSINYTTREIGLKADNGETRTVTVDESVSRFNEIKKGDRVTVKLTDKLSIAVTAPRERTSSAATTMTSQVTPNGRTATSTERATATVADINYEARTVTLQFQNGQSQSYEVAEDITRFNDVKKGDLVTVTYTAAIAASIDRN